MSTSDNQLELGVDGMQIKKGAKGAMSQHDAGANREKSLTNPMSRLRMIDDEEEGKQEKGEREDKSAQDEYRPHSRSEDACAAMALTVGRGHGSDRSTKVGDRPLLKGELSSRLETDATDRNRPVEPPRSTGTGASSDEESNETSVTPPWPKATRDVYMGQSMDRRERQSDKSEARGDMYADSAEGESKMVSGMSIPVRKNQVDGRVERRIAVEQCVERWMQEPSTRIYPNPAGATLPTPTHLVPLAQDVMDAAYAKWSWLNGFRIVHAGTPVSPSFTWFQLMNQPLALVERVALLQTAFWQTGYSFVNLVPSVMADPNQFDVLFGDEIKCDAELAMKLMKIETQASFDHVYASPDLPPVDMTAANLVVKEKRSRTKASELQSRLPRSAKKSSRLSNALRSLPLRNAAFAHPRVLAESQRSPSPKRQELQSRVVEPAAVAPLVLSTSYRAVHACANVAQVQPIENGRLESAKVVKGQPCPVTRVEVTECQRADGQADSKPEKVLENREAAVFMQSVTALLVSQSASTGTKSIDVSLSQGAPSTTSLRAARTRSAEPTTTTWPHNTKSRAGRNAPRASNPASTALALVDTAARTGLRTPRVSQLVCVASPSSWASKDSGKRARYRGTFVGEARELITKQLHADGASELPRSTGAASRTDSSDLRGCVSVAEARTSTATAVGTGQDALRASELVSEASASTEADSGTRDVQASRPVFGGSTATVFNVGEGERVESQDSLLHEARVPVVYQDRGDRSSSVPDGSPEFLETGHSAVRARESASEASVLVAIALRAGMTSSQGRATTHAREGTGHGAPRASPVSFEVSPPAEMAAGSGRRACESLSSVAAAQGTGSVLLKASQSVVKPRRTGFASEVDGPVSDVPAESTSAFRAGEDPPRSRASILALPAVARTSSTASPVPTSSAVPCVVVPSAECDVSVVAAVATDSRPSVPPPIVSVGDASVMVATGGPVRERAAGSAVSERALRALCRAQRILDQSASLRGEDLVQPHRGEPANASPTQAAVAVTGSTSSVSGVTSPVDVGESGGSMGSRTSTAEDSMGSGTSTVEDSMGAGTGAVEVRADDQMTDRVTDQMTDRMTDRMTDQEPVREPVTEVESTVAATEPESAVTGARNQATSATGTGSEVERDAERSHRLTNEPDLRPVRRDGSLAQHEVPDGDAVVVPTAQELVNDENEHPRAVVALAPVIDEPVSARWERARADDSSRLQWPFVMRLRPSVLHRLSECVVRCETDGSGVDRGGTVLNVDQSEQTSRRGRKPIPQLAPVRSSTDEHCRGHADIPVDSEAVEGAQEQSETGVGVDPTVARSNPVETPSNWIDGAAVPSDERPRAGTAALLLATRVHDRTAGQEPVHEPLHGLHQFEASWKRANAVDQDTTTFQDAKRTGSSAAVGPLTRKCSALSAECVVVMNSPPQRTLSPARPRPVLV